MSEIHPNDIGLATFADVGDVAKLKTTAKTVVEALNELYQNGSKNQNDLSKQLYVEGNDNVFVGENNFVYGNGNLIIGSNNIVVADNLILIGDNVIKYKNADSDYYHDWFDATNNTLYFFSRGDLTLTFPFEAGDKVLVNIIRDWNNSMWNDVVSVSTGPCIAEIVEADGNSLCAKIEGISIPSEPPDDEHTNEDRTYTKYFIPLNEKYLLNAGGCISFGGTPQGTKSAAFGESSSSGNYAFSTGTSNASGESATALCLSEAKGNGAFSANIAHCYGDKGAALNMGYAHTPYSFAHGYNSMVFGRPLKALSLDTTKRSIVIDSSYSLSGITAGKKIVLRFLDYNDSQILVETKVKSVSGKTIYLNDDVYLGDEYYSYQLFPDGIIFALDISTSYANASEAGGYNTIASGKFTTANGYYTIAGAEGANIWGKYGLTIEPYSLALANGTAETAPGLAFMVLSNGSVHADAEYTTPCADYAEFFEWKDGNVNAEDRVGYFVKLAGEKITKCDEFDTPLGIVSATPAIVGDSGEMHWKNKFVTDDFGRIQYHDVTIPEHKDEEGNIIIEEHIETQPILNPEWNSKEVYIPRKERREWSEVGVLGKLIVYDDGTLKPGDICRTGRDGIAVKSITNGYPVLKRISENKILIWFKG